VGGHIRGDEVSHMFGGRIYVLSGRGYDCVSVGGLRKVRCVLWGMTRTIIFGMISK